MAHLKKKFFYTKNPLKRRIINAKFNIYIHIVDYLIFHYGECEVAKNYSYFLILLPAIM